MNAAVAASGGMGGVGGQPGDAAAAKPSGGSSWASLVTKNIEKKPEAKALNAKGFTVLAGAATCVNGAPAPPRARRVALSPKLRAAQTPRRSLLVQAARARLLIGTAPRATLPRVAACRHSLRIRSTSRL